MRPLRPVTSKMNAVHQGRAIVRSFRTPRLENSSIRRLFKLDRMLVRYAKRVRVLASLKWPDQATRIFLKRWESGNAALPEISYRNYDFSFEIEGLDNLVESLDGSDPVEAYLKSTAKSYQLAAQMLESIGTERFTELSSELYGYPQERVVWNSMTQLDVADHFIDTGKEYVRHYHLPKKAYCVTAQSVAHEMEKALVPFFKDHAISVVLDPTLASKASARKNRICIRDGTCFSENDIRQLIQHEGFVHLLTSINGHEQPHLKSLGLPSPRVSCTQEGLATFAELATGVMDLSRLHRLASRVRAVHIAREGADFIDVFRYFLNNGQAPIESFHSARRVFRGGDVRGKAVFTKDVVYLKGLLSVQTFFRKLTQANKFNFAYHLFAGRLTLGDVVSLEPAFESGLISPAYYKPAWLSRRECLAAYLSYSVFTSKISLDQVSFDDFR
jgi:uncharacterized protein (TIGR02421 family)